MPRGFGKSSGDGLSGRSDAAVEQCPADGSAAVSHSRYAAREWTVRTDIFSSNAPKGLIWRQSKTGRYGR